MATDYDSTGQAYTGRSLPPNEVLYEVHLRLQSDTSIVDPGDILLFDWEYEATAEDRFEFVPTGVASEAGPSVPQQFVLYQNYPNPFNAQTVIRFSLDRPGRVQLRVYNVLGQVVKTLLQGHLPAGVHEVVWDGKDEAGRAVVSGVYIVQLVRGDERRRVKALVLR
ncbi:MAG: T9SS type A sorting domain-containing protein [Calditrichaeota bacterium]|nr:T9SS type A sorting domain-containing protein [Calditrichota bacterium]